MAPSTYGGLGPTMVAAVWSQAAVGTVLVGLRAYSASVKHGRLRWDFIFIVLALLSAIAASAMIHEAALHGLGQHIKLLTFPQIFQTVKWLWISVWVGLIPGVFAKLSIIALLLEVQGPNAKKRRYALWTLGFFITATSIVQLFLSMFQCRPFSRLWLLTSQGTCPNKVPSGYYSYFQGAVQALADFILALWPVTIAWNLQASRQVKIGFCLLMAGGMLPSIFVILRIATLPRAARSKEPTYEYGKFMIWAVSEVWTVIILGSIPPLRPLFLRVFYGIRPLTSKKGTNPTYGNTNGTPGGTALRSMKSIGGKKGVGVTDTQMLDAISDDGSVQELVPPHGIVVSHEYAVEDASRTNTIV